MPQILLFLYLAILNPTAFFVYGLDKSYARRRHRRISEKCLLLLALCGGALGALCGMLVFRHKTKHVLFPVGVPLILGLWCALLFFLFRPF